MPKTISNKEKGKAEMKDGAQLLGTTIAGSHAAHREEQIHIFAKENKYKPWPVVRFDNGLVRTIFPDCTVSELGNEEPYSLLSRAQIPLTAGYAITVHKSQACLHFHALPSRTNTAAGYVTRSCDCESLQIIRAEPDIRCSYVYPGNLYHVTS
jgi:DNA-directed RNA polymerase specialized sigma54-like protein